MCLHSRLMERGVKLFHRKVESFEEVRGRGVREEGRLFPAAVWETPFLDSPGSCRPDPGSKPGLNPRRPWAFSMLVVRRKQWNPRGERDWVCLTQLCFRVSSSPQCSSDSSMLPTDTWVVTSAMPRHSTMATGRPLALTVMRSRPPHLISPAVYLHLVPECKIMLGTDKWSAYPTAGAELVGVRSGPDRHVGSAVPLPHGSKTEHT